MKFCPNCKVTYDDSANVCGQCGGPLTYVPNQVTADPTDHTAEFDARDISENKVLAMVPYLLGVIGIIIALLAAGSSPYTAFHVKQALKIEVCGVIACIAAIVPILGWIFVGIAMLVLLVVTIICFFGVCNGKAKEAPIVSKFGFLK